MKHTVLAAFAVALSAMAMPAFASSQSPVPPAGLQPYYNGGNPGPAVSGSTPVTNLPEPALTFIVEYYPQCGIVDMEKEFASNTYEVELSDKTDLEFDSKGRLIEIDAPGNTAIAETVVQAILPAGAFNALKSKNIAGQVESIKLTRSGDYKVELTDNLDTEYLFNANGQLLSQRAD